MKIEKKAELLIFNFYKFIAWLNDEMKKPSSEQRGKRIARAVNRWEITIDGFAHSELGFTFRKIQNMKNKANGYVLIGAMDKDA